MDAKQLLLELSFAESRMARYPRSARMASCIRAWFVRYG